MRLTFFWTVCSQANNAAALLTMRQAEGTLFTLPALKAIDRPVPGAVAATVLDAGRDDALIAWLHVEGVGSSVPSHGPN